MALVRKYLPFGRGSLVVIEHRAALTRWLSDSPVAEKESASANSRLSLMERLSLHPYRFSAFITSRSISASKPKVERMNALVVERLNENGRVASKLVYSLSVCNYIVTNTPTRVLRCMHDIPRIEAAHSLLQAQSPCTYQPERPCNKTAPRQCIARRNAMTRCTRVEALHRDRSTGRKRNTWRFLAIHESTKVAVHELYQSQYVYDVCI